MPLSGFKLSEARDIDAVGTAGIIKRIKDTVGNRPVYFSLGAWSRAHAWRRLMSARH